MRQNTQQRDPRLIRGTKAILCGLTTFSLVTGLGFLSYSIPVAKADEADEIVVEHIGSTEVSEREAMARAEEARDEEIPKEIAEGKLLVEMFPESDEIAALSTALGDSGMRIENKVMDAVGDVGTIYLVSVPAGTDLSEAKAQILENTQVASVSYDLILQVDGTFDEQGGGQGQEVLAQAEALANDPAKSSKWEAGSNFLDFEGTWQKAREAGWTDSSNVTIALLDTGIVPHEDLDANIVYKYDISTGSSEDEDMVDEATDGHGTAVAGIASACTNNGIGTCSLAYNAKLLPIKVFTGSGNSYGARFDHVLAGLQWLVTPNETMGGNTPAKEYNVKVANLSVGMPTSQVGSIDYLKAGIQGLWDNGIILTNSMGNSVVGRQTVSVPYDHWPTRQSKDTCVGVIALKKDSDTTVVLDHQSNYNISDSNDDLVGKISAPGRSIYTTVNTNSSAYASGFSGTSAATPQVSSLLALMCSIYPNMTPEQVTDILYQSAKSVSGEQGTQQYVGYGMIDPLAAVQEVIALRESSYASKDELHGMGAYIGSTAVEGFDSDTASYTKDFGIVDSTPNTAVTFTNTPDPDKWSKTETSEQTDEESIDELGRTLRNYTKVTTVTFTSTHDSAQGSPIVAPYTFTMTWSIVTYDPDETLIAQLNGMTASANGSQLDGFTYTTTDYSKGYGTISPSQELPSEVTISIPSGARWTATPNPNNPLVNTNNKHVANDGTTTGIKTKKLGYTLTSTVNGTNGSPITRPYTFTFTGSYEDTSTKYTTVLQGIKLTIDGQEHENFDVATTSYAIKVDDADTLASMVAPSFTNLPDGWSQQASSPQNNVTETDNGNGTTTKHTSKTYTITLSNGQGGKVTYTVMLYAESTYDTPKPESDDGNGNGNGNQSGQQGSSDSQQPQQQVQPTSTNTTTNPSNGTTGTNSTTTQQRKATTQVNILQTGDAVAIIAGTIIVAGIGIIVWIQTRKNH